MSLFGSWFNGPNARGIAKLQRLLLALVAKHYPEQVATGTFAPGNTIDMLVDQLDNVTSALEMPPRIRPNICNLIDIQRDGRVLRFRFVRGDDVFTIETYAAMESNVAEWRKWAGLSK